MKKKPTKYTFSDVFNGRSIRERYTRIPHTLIDYAFDLGMDPQELVVVIFLLRMKYGRENPHPSYVTIARALGFSIQKRVRKSGEMYEESKAVQRVVARLVKKGLLKTRRRTVAGLNTSIEFDLDPLFARIEMLDARQLYSGGQTGSASGELAAGALPAPAEVESKPASNIRSRFGAAPTNEERAQREAQMPKPKELSRAEVGDLLNEVGLERPDCEQHLTPEQYGVLVKGGPESEVLTVIAAVQAAKAQNPRLSLFHRNPFQSIAPVEFTRPCDWDA